MRDRIDPHGDKDRNCNFCKHFVQWESRCYRDNIGGIWMDTEAECKCKYHKIGYHDNGVVKWIKIDENEKDI